jgi:Bifunctional DNA primase/polymerase, N-terminal/Primase C terminal 1 (PriCT-1)
MTDMLRAARRLAEKGLAVFPCQPQGKQPATLHGCKDATTDPGAIEKWWRRVPSYNIAVACGKVSGIVVVDIDSDDAEIEIKKLEAEYSALPPTVEAITAKGRHLFFRYPEQEVRNSASKLAPGVDTRGCGGYVVVPPSLHPTGKRYCWSVDSASAFADVPQWLLDKITVPAMVPGTLLPATVTSYADLIRGGVAEGCRNNSLVSLIGHLLRSRIGAETALEIALLVNEARFRPPLSRAEVIATASSIAALELKRRINQ